jgi:hypothetical protein
MIAHGLNMKQTTRLHDFFRSVIDWTIAPCEATPIASQDLLITGWKKSMRVSWQRTGALFVSSEQGMKNIYQGSREAWD